MPHSEEDIKNLQGKFQEFYKIIVVIHDGRGQVFPPPGPYTSPAEYAFTEAVLDNMIEVAGSLQRQVVRLQEAAELVVAEEG
jgi:hypothetical protein